MCACRQPGVREASPHPDSLPLPDFQPDDALVSYSIPERSIFLATLAMTPSMHRDQWLCFQVLRLKDLL
jgi:hypothetical protein